MILTGFLEALRYGRDRTGIVSNGPLLETPRPYYVWWAGSFYGQALTFIAQMVTVSHKDDGVVSDLHCGIG